MRTLARTAVFLAAVLMAAHPSTAQTATEYVVYEQAMGSADAVALGGPAAPNSGEGILYLLDNGTGNTNVGPPSAFDPDMLWGNYFLTQPGGEVITEIQVAFGPTFPSLDDGPVTFWLLDDPDMDLDPRNATALVSVQGTPDVFGNTFFHVDIPPTPVSGAFFVGASAQLQGGQDRPARVDTSHPGDRSWFFYAPDISEVINDLASAPFGTRMDNTEYVPFPGAFMIRAIGLPADDPPPPPGDVLLFEDFEDGLPDGWARFGNEHCCGVSLWVPRTENGVPTMRSRWTNSPPPGQVARDMLATPAITLGGSSTVRFAAARSFDDPDHTSLYAVWVAPVDEAAHQADIGAYAFLDTWTSTDFPLITDGWGIVDVDLSAYDNTDVYIAFVHTQNDGDNFNLIYVFITTEHAGAAVEPAELVFILDPAQPVGQQPLLLSNIADPGGGNLVFDIPTAQMTGPASRRPADAAVAPRAGGVTLTHSARMDIEDDVSACAIAGLGTRENHFWRVFDLAQFDVTGEVEVTAVEIGIGDVVVPDGALPSIVRLHRLEGEFVLENLTLVAEAAYHVLEPHAHATTVVSIPGGASFDDDDVLVVEWNVSSGLPTGSYVVPGGNAAGQTGPTFHSAPDCDLHEPTDLADLGAPDEHWVAAVRGTGESVLSVAPPQGAIEAGQGLELTVTADASALEKGAHHFELRVRTNVPDVPVLIVDVTVLVGPVSAEDGGTPRSFSVEQNYPNPFAGTSTIAYSLPRPADVRITVYDSMGRRIATLIDAFQPAGRHEVGWDASGLAAGVYLYRIRAGDFAAVRRAVVAH